MELQPNNMDMISIDSFITCLKGYKAKEKVQTVF